MSKPATISDIAQAAKVSRSTVSRVLTGVVPVAPEKRAAVLAAIERMNFHPNIVARSLVHGKTMTIGVLTQSMASPFYGDLALGIERGLAHSNYNPMFASGQWQAETEQGALRMLLARQVDALIVLGGSLPGEELRATNERVPLIVVGRTVAGLEDRCLRVEDYQGAYRATRHLIDLGHRRIAHVSGIPSHADAIERQRGYKQALHDASLAFDPELVVAGNFTEHSGFEAGQELLSRNLPFTAVFAANDQLAYGVRLAFYRAGRQVPEDVSLVGFDDQPNSAYAIPPLTTVRQHTYEMGVAAAEGVLTLLDSAPLALPVFTPELILRDSTARVRQPGRKTKDQG